MISNPKTPRNEQTNVDFFSVKLNRQTVEISEEGIVVTLMVCKRDGR